MGENEQTANEFGDPDEGAGFFRVCPLSRAVGVCVMLRGGGELGEAIAPEVVRRLVDALEAALP